MLTSKGQEAPAALLDHYSTLIPNLSTAREELHDRLEGSDGDVNRLLAPARVAAKNLARKF
jgi:hypothetical protein